MRPYSWLHVPCVPTVVVSESPLCQSLQRRGFNGDAGTDRIAKYNQLLRIEEELDAQGVYGFQSLR